MNTSRILNPVAKKISDGGERGEFIGAGLDEDDGAGRADQPDQRALQARARRAPPLIVEGNPRLSPHTP